jgi:hypothetical protein
MENPRTQFEFDNSVVHKRYILGFANNYASLFYMAFLKVLTSFKKFHNDSLTTGSVLLAFLRDSHQFEHRLVSPLRVHNGALYPTVRHDASQIHGGEHLDARGSVSDCLSN